MRRRADRKLLSLMVLGGALCGCGQSDGGDGSSEVGIATSPTTAPNPDGSNSAGTSSSSGAADTQSDGTSRPIASDTAKPSENGGVDSEPSSSSEDASKPDGSSPDIGAAGGAPNDDGTANGGTPPVDPTGSGAGEPGVTPAGTTNEVDPAPADGCPEGLWPEADPSQPGPFEVATENEVGPEAGEPEEDGTVPRFTVFRPENMDESGLCHPVITWGNGTGSTPNLYGGLLKHLASHGFVIVGSNSTNVARGEPRPMNVGIDWILEQNEDPTSALYHRIDTAHIGATGHSQGAVATSQASSDERIVTSLPIEGAQPQRDLHGPAMFFCGGQDDIVGCDGAVRALESVTTLPAMYANYLSVDHGSWLSFGGNSRTDVEVAITAWMRVHLMADNALRPWFYGESCELCTNSDWEIDRKNMDD